MGILKKLASLRPDMIEAERELELIELKESIRSQNERMERQLKELQVLCDRALREDNFRSLGEDEIVFMQDVMSGKNRIS